MRRHSGLDLSVTEDRRVKDVLKERNVRKAWERFWEAEVDG